MPDTLLIGTNYQFKADWKLSGNQSAIGRVGVKRLHGTEHSIS